MKNMCMYSLIWHYIHQIKSMQIQDKNMATVLQWRQNHASIKKTSVCKKIDYKVCFGCEGQQTKSNSFKLGNFQGFHAANQGRLHWIQTLHFQLR